MAGTGLPAIVASSYLASDIDLDMADLSYSERETDLLMEVDKTEQTYPGYDEYRYRISDVSHNPYELVAFLTELYQDFQYVDIKSILKNIFADQYILSYNETVETRSREDEYGEMETYDWHIMTVTSKPQLIIL